MAYLTPTLTLIGAAQNLVLAGSFDPENVIKNVAPSAWCSIVDDFVPGDYDQLPAW